MENLVFKWFTVLSKSIGALIVVGIFTGVLVDIQRLAFNQKRRGLVSMSSVNGQLVGETPWLKANMKRGPVQK